MCAVAKKVISQEELITQKIICKDAVLPNEEYVLLKGIVYSPQKIPLPHAAIDIIQIDSNVIPKIERNIGVTFTLEDGSYGVSLLWKSGYSYELTAYSPA